MIIKFGELSNWTKRRPKLSGLDRRRRMMFFFSCKCSVSLENTLQACSVAADFYHKITAWFNKERNPNLRRLSSRSFLIILHYL